MVLSHPLCSGRRPRGGLRLLWCTLLGTAYRYNSGRLTDMTPKAGECQTARAVDYTYTPTFKRRRAQYHTVKPFKICSVIGDDNSC